MTEMDELKPCPFCGYAPTGEEELLDILDVDEFGEKVEKIKYVGVSCAGCCAYVPVQTHDKTEAVAAWNRRPSRLSDWEPGPRAYLIRKSGAWYRPQSKGYTNSVVEAGRFTLAEADKITHPNGPDGPRDGMSFVHQNEVASPSPPPGHVAVPVERLTTVLDEYDAQTKALPLGHEDRTRGASSYNWRRSVVDELRAMLSALPHNQGGVNGP